MPRLKSMMRVRSVRSMAAPWAMLAGTAVIGLAQGLGDIGTDRDHMLEEQAQYLVKCKAEMQKYITTERAMRKRGWATLSVCA